MLCLCVCVCVCVCERERERERELSQYDDKATDLEINIRFPIGGRDVSFPQLPDRL
jgi:hypothetical protein